MTRHPQSTSGNRQKCILVCVSLAVAGPGCGTETSVDSRCPHGVCNTVVPESEVGFIELGSRDYSVDGNAFSAGPARFFFDFQPAATPSERSPLFIVTGGGPAASALFMLAFHAPRSVVLDGLDAPVIQNNDTSLVELGHLLTIEARNAGFSYPLLNAAGDRTARATRSATGDYNPFRDAADIWEVFFEWLERHPDLQHHPIYFLTESYGATRVQVMLSLLYHAEEYAAGQRRFVDAQLMEQLLSFRPDLDLGGQILVEPWFAGLRQAQVTASLFETPGSPLDALAETSGLVYERCGAADLNCSPYDNALRFLTSVDRSLYDYRDSNRWIDHHLHLVAGAATDHQHLAAVCGVDAAALDEVFAVDRNPAFRYVDPAQGLFAAQGDLEQQFGALNPWDDYFVPLNVEAHDAFVSEASELAGLSANRADWGEMLVNNVRALPTMITRARYDLLIYGPALVPVLESYTAIRRARFVQPPTPDAPNTTVELEFADGLVRNLFSPEYESSHSVSQDAAVELIRDIASFVATQAH